MVSIVHLKCCFLDRKRLLMRIPIVSPLQLSPLAFNSHAFRPWKKRWTKDFVLHCSILHSLPPPSLFTFSPYKSSHLDYSYHSGWNWVEMGSFHGPAYLPSPRPPPNLPHVHDTNTESDISFCVAFTVLPNADRLRLLLLMRNKDGKHGPFSLLDTAS